MHSDLDRFYAILAGIATQPLQGHRLCDLTGRSGLPKRGVYFFLEQGEERVTPSGVPRVVRVGTHAVSAGSRSRLWGRLRTHRGSLSGRGNHRGSIFRLHVGAALLEREQRQHASWGIGSSAPGEIRVHEADLEHQVSAHIGGMSVLWVAVPDEPSATSARAVIERNSIALLSNNLCPADPPSRAWLGSASPRESIRLSGLWNLNHVVERHDPRFLDTLELHAAKASLTR